MLAYCNLKILISSHSSRSYLDVNVSGLLIYCIFSCLGQLVVENGIKQEAYYLGSVDTAAEADWIPAIY